MAEQLICNQQVDGSTPFTSSIYMGEFPSGQRGQTVNLLSLTSLVRIQLPPPCKKAPILVIGVFLSPPSHSRCASVAGSLLHLLALGGFAATKTTLSCFCLATSWSEAPTLDLSLASASDAGSHTPRRARRACS